MKATPIEIAKYLKTLEDTPMRITHATNGIDDSRLQFNSDKRSWSANDILAHIRACADLWTHSIYAMLAVTYPRIVTAIRKASQSKGVVVSTKTAE